MKAKTLKRAELMKIDMPQPSPREYRDIREGLELLIHRTPEDAAEYLRNEAIGCADSGGDVGTLRYWTKAQVRAASEYLREQADFLETVAENAEWYADDE
jgi:hypothetical protein